MGRGRRKSAKVESPRPSAESRCGRGGEEHGDVHAGTRQGAGGPGRGGLPAERRDGGLESVVHSLHYVVLGRCISQCSQRNGANRMCVYIYKIITGIGSHNRGGWQVLGSAAGKPESRESQRVVPV